MLRAAVRFILSAAISLELTAQRRPRLLVKRLPARTVGALGVPGQPGRILAWGERLLDIDLSGRKPTVRDLGPGPFGEGGCIVDANGDGLLDLVVQRGVEGESGLGKLVWLRAPDWREFEIDSGVEMHDCMAATLHGRRGFLMIQRGIQVRFYEPAANAWPYTEIYSIYTASKQSGLLMTDIDGDGRADIVCGNYWIRNPERFELPWRLFAINLLNSESRSASLRFALDKTDLIVSQGEFDEGQLLRYRKPADPTQLWDEHPLAKLRRPHALINHGGAILVGENSGAGSRLWPAGMLRHGVHTFIQTDRGLIAVGPDAISIVK